VSHADTAGWNAARVRVTFFCLLVALGVGLAAAPAAAQPAGRLDVEPIIAALDGGERLVRGPDTVARFDEARVRGELGPTVRLVVLPYVDYDLYEDANGESLYYDLVRGPILDWALDREVPVVLVEGVDVTLLNGASSLDHQLPADLDELRTTAATHEVTERLLVLSRLGSGIEPEVAEDVEIVHPAPVPATPEQVAEVAATLGEGRIHNAAGRTDPIESWVPEQAKEEFDLTVRVAAFPVLEPGQPVVDYVTPLKAAFPDDVVLVLHGDWVDIAAPDQDKALAARAFAYGDADLSLFTVGDGGNSLLRQLIDRLALLTAETSWGFPQPAPQPRPAPFDVARTIAALAPWVFVGSAVALGGAGALRHRTRVRAAAAAEAVALRAEGASAMATITELGAQLLSIEESGERADPAAAERHATARLLYDQALTSAAMVEVRRVAEEGLELLTDDTDDTDETEVDAEVEPAPAARVGRAKKKKPRKPARKFPPMPRGTWRKTR
jgi:hypothetical protein